MAIIRKFDRGDSLVLPNIEYRQYNQSVPKQKGKEQKDWELKEVEASEPIYKYFTKRGYKARSEIFNHDWLFFNDNEIICVELKKGFNDKLLTQCRIASCYFTKVYGAVLQKPSQKSIQQAKDAEIGLIYISKNSINILVEPIHTSRWELRFNQYMERLKLAYNIHGNSLPESAGIPNLKGCGVAQSVLKDVKCYVQEHRDADWEEIYKNVPNHYAHAKSLSGAMRTWQGFNLSEYKESLKIGEENK